MSFKRALILLLALALFAPAAIADEALPLPQEAVGLPPAEAEIALPAPEGVDAVPGPAGELSAQALNDEPQTPEPAKPRTIRLTKTTAASAYMGVAYRLAVANGDAIKYVRTSNAAVAAADRAGDVTLSGVGKAKLTAVTKGGRKYVLTLTVKAAPAPSQIGIETGKRHFALMWKPARHATGYRVETSADAKHWTAFKCVRAAVTKTSVTAAVAGTTRFRVVAMFGDHDLGVSESVSVLDPVTGVEVICEEDYSEGPTNRLNVTWNPSPGATGYAVYRASLPSEDYRLLGTTKKLYYADVRSARELYAYRVRPVWGDLDLECLPLSAPATLWTGYQDNVLPPRGLESQSGIILVVNKKAQVTTAYIQDADGRYSIPLRHMICTTGWVYERTRIGTYVIERRMNEWYTYPGPSGDTIRWPTVYRPGYYFHSPLYNRDHTIRSSSLRQLGSRGSAGCVRLKVREAEWVYKNCPNGTVVYICDGAPKDALKEKLYPKDVSVKGF